GVATLVGVGVQGILGKLRVDLQSAGWGLEFAMIHGFFGQVVFSLAASVALVTSRGWLSDASMEVDQPLRFRRLCVLTTGLLLAQLLAGVWLRQQGEGDIREALFVHIVFALAVMVHIGILAARLFRQWHKRPKLLRGPIMVMLALLGLQ